MQMSRCVGLGLLLFLLVSCRPGPVQPTANSSSRPDRQVYQVKGVIQEVMPDRNKLKIEHEEIPGYMEAMTMIFDVRGTNPIDQFQAGDSVTFDMVVTPSDGWIENVVKTGASGPVRQPFRVVRDVEPLALGDYVPDYRFTNELGQMIRLQDFKGQAVALTFIYTRCPFPTFCPRMSSNFAAALQKLQAKPEGATNWHLLTLTFDPEFDTPAVLRAYGKQFDYNPKKWSFLTGDLMDITALAEQFGLMFWRSDPNKPASIDHNIRTVVIDREGRVAKIIPENEWKVDELVEAIEAAAQPGSSQSSSSPLPK